MKDKKKYQDKSKEMDKVAHYYNRVSKIYDSSYESPYWKIYHKATWENLRKHLPRDMSSKILDIGGGTGLWAIKIAKSGFQVVLADISVGMLDTAQKKCEAEKLLKKVSFTVCDICDMKEFSDESFELVVSEGDPISCCSNPRKAIQEIYRVTKPGGKTVCSVDNKWGAMHHFLDQGKIDELENFLRTGLSHWLTESQEEQFEVRFFSPEEIQKMFEDAGFTVISIIGKTIIPWRRYPKLLENRDQLEQLIRIELSLNQHTSLLGSASHIEIVAAKK